MVVDASFFCQPSTALLSSALAPSFPRKRHSLKRKQKTKSSIFPSFAFTNHKDLLSSQFIAFKKATRKVAAFEELSLWRSDGKKHVARGDLSSQQQQQHHWSFQWSQWLLSVDNSIRKDNCDNDDKSHYNNNNSEKIDGQNSVSKSESWLCGEKTKIRLEEKRVTKFEKCHLVEFDLEEKDLWGDNSYELKLRVRVIKLRVRVNKLRVCVIKLRVRVFTIFALSQFPVTRLDILPSFHPSHSRSNSLSFALILFSSLSLSFPRSHSLFLTLTLFPSLSLSFPRSYSRSLTLIFAHSLSFSLTLSLAVSLRVTPSHVIIRRKHLSLHRHRHLWSTIHI